MFGSLFKKKPASKLKPGKKIISFSLWGSHPKYLQGALENVRLQKIVYPDWICRFYLDSTVPSDIVGKLREQECEIVAKPSAAGFLGLFWRFEVGFDPSIERFIVRDCDSRLNAREAWAVGDWIDSGKPFHIMRDHSFHNIPILGGMWGAVSGFIPNYESLYRDWISRTRIVPHKRGDGFHSDQEFLCSVIWPLVRHNHIAHSETHFITGEEKPFQVRLPEGCFVGQQHNENNQTILI